MGDPTTGPYITLMTTKNFGAAGNCPDDSALSSFRCPFLYLGLDQGSKKSKQGEIFVMLNAVCNAELIDGKFLHL